MIGIDIGSRFIKVCKVVDDQIGERESSLMENYTERVFHVYSVIKNIGGMDAGEKTQTLVSLLRKLGIEKEECFLAVGGKDLIDRNIFLPADGIASDEVKNNAISDFQSSVEEEAESVYFANTVFTNAAGKPSNVICSAVPKEFVDDKLDVVASVKGLSVKGINMEAFALTNAFEKFGPGYRNNENVVLINIGANVSNIVILKNKELIFFKDIDFGGQNITKDIMENYTVAELLAEELKIKNSLKQKIGFNMTSILKRTTANLIENIFSSIEYCINKQFIISADRIVLTGGGALTEGLETFIEKTLGIPTDKWNPLECNKFAGYTDKDYGYFIPISLGLALEKEQK